MAESRNIPTRIKMPDGEVYRLVIMRVENTREDLPKVAGMEIPNELMYVDELDMIELGRDTRFVTAYLPETVFGEARKKGE